MKQSVKHDQYDFERLLSVIIKLALLKKGNR